MLLRERSQSRRTACCIISLIRNIQNWEIYREGKQISSWLGLGKGHAGATANGHSTVFLSEKRKCSKNVMMVIQIRDYAKMY